MLIPELQHQSLYLSGLIVENPKIRKLRATRSIKTAFSRILKIIGSVNSISVGVVQQSPASSI